MAGATEAGDDFSVGRTNKSEERSLLVAINGDPDGYQTDFVLDVSTEGNKVLTKNADGVDAIHATGTVSFATGGAIGTIPEGNGIVARGLNGVAGYAHAAPRDKNIERDVHAGVLGVGGSGSPGVLGRGVNGVIGYRMARRAISRGKAKIFPGSSAMAGEPARACVASVATAASWARARTARASPEPAPSHQAFPAAAAPVSASPAPATRAPAFQARRPKTMVGSSRRRARHRSS